MKKFIFLCIYFLVFSVHSQVNKSKPFLEPYLKMSYAFVDDSKPAHVLDTEFSLYINSFGNITDCGEDNSFVACLLANVVLIVSVFEITGGFDTVLNDGKFYVAPKAAFYLRPLYYGKAGLTFSTYNISSSIGITIPLKNDFLIELLYQSSLDNYKKTPFYEPVSRFQIGLQIPLYIDLSTSKKSKKILF